MDDDIRSLLEGPNYVHVATLMPDGAPHSVAMWGGVEGDHVAISVVDHGNPYRTGQLRGRVVETRHGAEALAAMDCLAEKYTGEPFPWRTDEGTLYVIAVDWSRYAELPFTHVPG